MADLEIRGSYSDLEPVNKTTSAVQVPIFQSKSFYRDFFMIFDKVAASMDLHHFKPIFEKLVAKGKLIIFFTKTDIVSPNAQGELQKRFRFYAVYDNNVDTIFVPFLSFRHGPYYANLVNMLSSMCHELGHFLFNHKPKETIDTFSPLLQLFFRMVYTTYLEKRGMHIDVKMKKDIDEMISQFFVGVDFGFPFLMVTDIEDFFSEKKFPQKVQDLIMNLTNILISVNNPQAGSMTLAEKRFIVTLMTEVHCKLAHVPTSTFKKASAGMPYQEFFAPSEIIICSTDLARRSPNAMLYSLLPRSSV